jgi:hypothetical protein
LVTHLPVVKFKKIGSHVYVLKELLETLVQTL